MFTDLFQLEKKPVTVFSSSDANAPQLTADKGSLKTVLKACLSTGYGDKQPLGFEAVYESDDHLSAVFRSTDQTSSKHLFKIDNSIDNFAKLSSYRNMTDINTGTQPIAENLEYKLFSADWKLVGHEKGFVFLVDYELNSQRLSAPIVFSDLPREKKRLEPLSLLWCARVGSNSSASLQLVLFKGTAGSDNDSDNAYPQYQLSYPFRVAHGGGSVNLDNNYCRFFDATNAAAAALWEPVFSCLPDSTWTFLPMLLPISLPINDIANLSLINANALRAQTGMARYKYINADCAVPTDWWYA